MKLRYALLSFSVLTGISQAETITDACFNCPDLTTIADASSFVDNNYYANVLSAISNGYSQAEIKEQLMLTIKNGHKNLTYSEVWTALTETDEDPANADNVLLLYKGISIAKFSNGSGSQSSNPDNWNREHVWAKSHGFSSSSTEAYSDIHHLRPTDISVNSSRGNLDFDNSDSPLDEAPENRVDGDSFEPRDTVKGDVARMLFYMDTRYEGQDITPDLELVNRITSTGEAKLGKLCRLIEWHTNDPVDEIETNRNNRIYEFQGNRNPFIDHPEWVDVLYSADTCSTGETPDPDPIPDPEPDPDPEPTPSTGNLFISEYVEGSSYNKVIELYNPTNEAINLADLNYVLTRYSNGSTSGSDIALAGTVEANSTFIIANSRAATEVLDIAQQVTGSLSHNGDDAYVLFKDGEAVDSFGRVGEDPGSQWGSDTYKTKDNSLQRNSSILSGDVNYTDAFDPAQEWTGTSNNDFTNLGSHTVDSAEIFISEYIEGSSYNKAIELFNPGSNAIDLTAENYYLERYSNGSNSGTAILLSGTIGASDVFVIAEPRANSDILAQADQTSNLISHNGDDAYVLFKGAEIIDSFGRVGEDPGSNWGSGTTKTKDNTLVRLSSITEGDTETTDSFDPALEWQGLGNNNSDSLGAHVVDNSGEEPVSSIGECYAEAVAIHDVQGEGDTSPLIGQQVVVEGVVTAVHQHLGGFFLQEELVDQDNNSATSEAVFIYSNNHDYPFVGDVVRSIGNVSEFYGRTQVSLSESPLNCGIDSVPTTPLTLPFASDTAAESLEGMLVHAEQTLTVTDSYNLGRFGEVTLSNGRLYVPTNKYAPGSTERTELATMNELNKLLLDDANSKQNPEDIRYPTGGLSPQNTLRLGDKVDNLQGILDFAYSKYRIIPSEQPSFIQENIRTEAPVISNAGNLRIANANLLNFFNGDGQGAGFPTSRGADSFDEYLRQKDKTVNALLAMNADIIAIQEIENDGFGQHSALQSLVDALNATSNDIDYRFVNPGVEQFGGDHIKVALIYNAKTVTEFGTAAYLLDFPFEYHNRPPLTQTFRSTVTGERITVSVNHFRSKGCSSSGGVENEDKHDGQACYNLRRVQAAQTLLSWLATHPTGIDDSDIIILGDLNAYNKEDPVTTLINGGFTDLMQTFKGDDSYTYSIFGEIGALDHVMTSNSLTEKVVDVATWHINADEPRIFDYNTEYKSDNQLNTLYTDEPVRASDHDPIVVEIAGVTPLISVKDEYSGLGTNARWSTFEFNVPDTSVSFTVKTSGGEGNVDLYVEQGKKPNTQKFSCAPRMAGNEEVCEFENPTAGKWYIRLRGERHYNDVNLTIEALYPEKLD